MLHALEVPRSTVSSTSVPLHAIKRNCSQQCRDFGMDFAFVMLVVVYKGLQSFILLVEGRPMHCTREVTSSVNRLLRHLTLVQKVVCLPSAAICWCFPHFFDLQHLP